MKRFNRVMNSFIKAEQKLRKLADDCALEESMKTEKIKALKAEAQAIELERNAATATADAIGEIMGR